MAENVAVVKVFRFDPSVDEEPRYETYQIPHEVWNNRKVMDVLRYIYENLSPDLAFRESCYQGLCACCMIRMNNKPVLSCETMAEQEMILDPVNKERVIKDLVTIFPKK